MRFVLGLLVAYLVAVPPLWAGAWLRDQGTGFLSFGTTVQKPSGAWQLENSFYGEIGVFPRLTLGLDIHDASGRSGHTVLFARVPVSLPRSKTKMAIELGLGGHHQFGLWQPMAKTTLSLGRNFSTRWGEGWINIDTALELRHPSSTPTFKLDASIGLSDGLRFRPMLQIETTHIKETPLIWSITPSILISTRKKSTLAIGIQRKTIGQSELGLKINLWRRF